MLPKVFLEIVSDQAKIAIVNPQESVHMTITQTDLRVAESGNQYRYNLDLKRAKLSDLKSNDEADHIITINALESMISAYEKH